MQLTRLGTVDELNDAGTTRVIEGPLDFVERYRHFDPAHTWENINVSPDFSVTGEVISRLYPQSGGRQVDGVVAVDLRGLAALLDLAGPIRVDGWPEAVTAANLVDVVVREAAVRVPDPAEREAFLNRLYRRTVESFLAADLGSPSRLAAALGPAVQGGHLLLYASQAEEEALFRRLGAAGQIQRTVGDSLLVVNQNLSATPVDAHLRRSIRYDLRLDPGREPAAVTGKVEVTLANEAATENRTETTVYSPFGLATPAAGIQSASELGRRAHSTIAAIPAHQSRTVSFDLAGRLELASDHWYHLRVSHQAVLVPDRTEISLSVPSGWQIAEVRGGSDVVDGRRAQITVSRNDDVVSVRLERTAWSRLWAHVGD
jgi:hypothetical protein